MLFCSYYTENTPYEERAARLARSLDRFGLDYRIEGLPAKASWVENCAQKANFVKMVRDESEEPICWLDADAIVYKNPTTLLNFNADFGIVAWDGWQFSGGQILLGNSPASRTLVSKWAQYASDNPNIWDQVTLAYAWWDTELETGLETQWLPETLIVKRKGNLLSKLRQRLFNRRAEVFHWQASRENKQKQEVVANEFPDSKLPTWWREAVRKRQPFELTVEHEKELGLVK